jgi:ComF family protein
MHSWITSVYAYNDFRAKRLIHLLKYKNARGGAEVLAPALADALSEFLGEEHMFLGSRKICIVPIPLSKKRMKKRGYNQAELLARKTVTLINDTNVFLETNLLKKIKETSPQAEIKNRGKRLKNLGDCFAVVRASTREEVVVLVDDVTTTGATLTAARKALRAAGFRKIYGLTVAH